MNNTTIEKRHYTTSADYYNPIDDLLEMLRLTKEEEQILQKIKEVNNDKQTDNSKYIFWQR